MHSAKLLLHFNMYYVAKRCFIFFGFLIGILYLFGIGITPLFADTPYTTISYTYDGDGNAFVPTQTLTADHSPYLILGGCTDGLVKPGNTLTIEAGVVVKFDQRKFCSGFPYRTFLEIEGSLIVNGSVDHPVIFTSLYDDTISGDTNGDGGATTPGAGDWGMIEVTGPSSSVQMSHAIIRYGGGGNTPAMLHINGNPADIELNNIEIAFSASAGLFTNNPLAITNSSFHNNLIGVSAEQDIARPQIDARNNWWGDASGPTVASNPGGKGDKIIGDVLYDPWVGGSGGSPEPTSTSGPTIAPPALTVVTSSPNGIASSTIFSPRVPVFLIRYSDGAGTAPTAINVVVGHTSSTTTYPLSLASNEAPSYEAGVLFTSTIPSSTIFASGTYSYHFEAQAGATALRFPTSGDLAFTVKHEPVIIIPGILGTNLVKDNENIWFNLLSLTKSLDDSFMDTLALDSKGMPIDNAVMVGDILRSPAPVLFDYSTGLLNELATAGYAENRDVFVFPYDWRLDNKVTSQKLADFVAQVTTRTGSPGVMLIAHSMGGLIAKQYLLDNPTSTVDTLIFVGTPQLGAPIAFKDLLLGDTFDIPFIVNPDEMRKLSENMPSVYQLLPTTRYISEFGGYFFNNTTTAATAASTKNYIVAHDGNAALWAGAESFHSDALDTFRASNIATYNIVGCAMPTIGTIRARPHQRLIRTSTVDYTVNEVSGDETVPLESALAMRADGRYYVLGAKHSKMLSDSSVSALLTQIVTNGISSAAWGTKITTDTSKCVLPKGKLVSVHSPITLNVYDASGNHVGPTSDGFIEENIPGAAYQTVGEEKFIFLPEDAGQTYTATLAATASGTFSFYVDTLDNGATTQSVYYRDIPITAAGSGSITVSADSDDTTLPFDQTGSGTTTPIPATSVLASAAAADATPPVTNDVIQGTINVSGAYVGSATVSLDASDDTAGVLETDYSLDNGATWQQYSAPITLTKSGVTAIMYRTVDRAGNEESTQSVMITIVPATNGVSNAPVTVINRIYGGGGFVPPIPLVPSSTTSTVHVMRTSTMAVVTSSPVTTTPAKPVPKVTAQPKAVPVKKVLGVTIKRSTTSTSAPLLPTKPVNGRSW